MYICRPEVPDLCTLTGWARYEKKQSGLLLTGATPRILSACPPMLDILEWYLLRMVDGSVDFGRTWSEYATGFGSMSGSFWWGLDNLHLLTNNCGKHNARFLLTFPPCFDSPVGTFHTDYAEFMVQDFMKRGES